MGRRLALAAAIILFADLLHADNPFPAVNLPAAVPDSVRDQTARALAASRDTLGEAVHPFRGEFHGLGAHANGYSRAYDLSANGRVVVGADYGAERSSEGFVWTPWTGRATYDMRPVGVTGPVVATAVSADGVYVGGHVTHRTSYSERSTGFRWSLADSEAVPEAAFGSAKVAALSGDGRTIAATSSKPVWVYGLDPYWVSDLSDDNNDGAAPLPPSVLAYRYTRSNGVGILKPSEGYTNSEAVDISADGAKVVANFLDTATGIYASFSEPAIWKDDGGIERLGKVTSDALTPGVLNRPSAGVVELATAATAISADGSTVSAVGYGIGFISDVCRDRVTVAESERLADDINGYGNDYGDIHTVYVVPVELPAIWSEPHGWTLLGDLKTDPGISTFSARPTSLSSDGKLVVGLAQTRTYTLERVPASWDSPYYTFCTKFEDVPFLWDEQRGMRDLADVLQYDYGLDLGGWDLREATAISDDGTTIIGNGRNPDGGQEAWRAVLHRETPDGDFDFDGDVDHLDYATLMGNLGLNSDDVAVFYADGDLNADGRVDTVDSMALLGLYEHRSMGDYNADGVVDLGDYTVWRDHLGELARGVADGNGDGRVDHADLAVWRAHHGEYVARLVAHRAPEPATLVGVLLGLVVTATIARRRAGV